MEVAEQLRHANILPVLYVGRQPEHLFMVMPYVAGGSLDRLLDERRCLSPTFAARLVTQIGAALDVAHNHGIVHRDVKPANILLLEDGQVALADFGLAKVMDGLSTQLTEAGTVVGGL